jgi:hypothetical protein
LDEQIARLQQSFECELKGMGTCGNPMHAGRDFLQSTPMDECVWATQGERLDHGVVAIVCTRMIVGGLRMRECAHS